MRLVTYCKTGSKDARLGVRQGKKILDLGPGRMKDLLAGGPPVLEKLKNKASSESGGLEEKDITYLPPIPDADKFLCVGKNYRQHLEELRRNDLLAETPQEPTAFVKLNSCLTGHETQVKRQ